MNQLQLFVGILVPMALTLGSCSSDNLPELTPAADSYKTVESVQLRSIKKYLRTSRKGTRSGDCLITPYVIEGDTVMYVAQFESGWELFSNSLAAPMSLMKSETGTFFEATNTDNRAFADLFNSIVSSLRQNLNSENT